MIFFGFFNCIINEFKVVAVIIIIIIELKTKEKKKRHLKFLKTPSLTAIERQSLHFAQKMVVDSSRLLHTTRTARTFRTIS